MELYTIKTFQSNVLYCLWGDDGENEDFEVKVYRTNHNACSTRNAFWQLNGGGQKIGDTNLDNLRISNFYGDCLWADDNENEDYEVKLWSPNDSRCTNEHSLWKYNYGTLKLENGYGSCLWGDDGENEDYEVKVYDALHDRCFTEKSQWVFTHICDEEDSGNMSIMKANFCRDVPSPPPTPPPTLATAPPKAPSISPGHVPSLSRPTPFPSSPPSASHSDILAEDTPLVNSNNIIIIVLVVVVLGIMSFGFGYYCRRKNTENMSVPHEENISLPHAHAELVPDSPEQPINNTASSDDSIYALDVTEVGAAVGSVSHTTSVAPQEEFQEEHGMDETIEGNNLDEVNVDSGNDTKNKQSKNKVEKYLEKVNNAGLRVEGHGTHISKQNKKGKRK